MCKARGEWTFNISLVRPNVALENLALSIDVVKNDSTIEPLMTESEWDILLHTERGLKIPSDEIAEVVAQVFRRNMPVNNLEVRLYTERQNPRSPNVASFTQNLAYTNSEGIMRAFIKAIDLNNSNGVWDPVDRLNYDQLPMDRNYGNYVYLSIKNPLRRTEPAIEEIEIAVRVLHKIDFDKF